MTSHAFYYSILLKMQRAAGGLTLAESVNGVKQVAGGPDFMWDGIPGYLAADMPQATAVSSNVLYVGDFARSTKLGEVRNAMEIASSDQRYFDQDSLNGYSTFPVS